jgi:hypothetical protein
LGTAEASTALLQQPAPRHQCIGIQLDRRRRLELVMSRRPSRSARVRSPAGADLAELAAALDQRSIGNSRLRDYTAR